MRGGRTIINSKPNSFNSTWKTDNTSISSSAANQIALPLSISGSYNFTVYWGDNTSSSISSSLQPETTHSYAAVGTYPITMSGYIRGFFFNNNRDRRKIIDISQWGGVKLSANGGQFYGCNALTLNNVADTPNLYSKSLLPGFSASMANMFRSCSLITTISRLDQWDTSQVQYMGVSFYAMPLFNQNIGSWNVGRVTNLDNMFSMAVGSGSFDNGGSDSIGDWDTSKVVNMSTMFQLQPKFNRNISNWNTSNVVSMSFMFTVGGSLTGSFNQDIGNWNTSKVGVMNAMFYNQRSFNQDLSSWNTSNVTNMNLTFGSTGRGSFNNADNSDIKNWNTSNVTNMNAMFYNQPYFNHEIGLWDVSKVTNMNYMLGSNAYSGVMAGTFNNGGSDSIKNWNTSNVTNMNSLFSYQKDFNQPIGNWNLSKVTDIGQMFRIMAASQSSFNQDIGNWNVSAVTNAATFMENKTFNDYSTTNYDALLIGWASRSVRPNISINFGSIRYTAAASASRATLTSTPNNWTIIDGGQI